MFSYNKAGSHKIIWQLLGSHILTIWHYIEWKKYWSMYKETKTGLDLESFTISSPYLVINKFHQAVSCSYNISHQLSIRKDSQQTSGGLPMDSQRLPEDSQQSRNELPRNSQQTPSGLPADSQQTPSGLPGDYQWTAIGVLGNWDIMIDCNLIVIWS